MKSFGLKLLCAVFVIVICMSQIACAFIESENRENRTISIKPKFSADNIDGFIDQYSKYADDHILMRNELVTLNNYIDYHLFLHSPNENVIIGKDNWLFYAKKEDGDPMACYNGSNAYTEEELAQITENCRKQKDYLASLGKEYIIFIAPNKERVYAENMPPLYGEPAETYRALQIVNYLREHTDITVIYPYDEMIRYKSILSEPLYYKTDTHWNQIGAYIGASEILKKLGIEMPEIENLDRIAFDWVWGDLSGLLGLQNELAKNSFQYAVNGYDAHNMTYLQNDFGTVIHCTAENADPRRIYFIRDSFSGAMVPYISSQFAESYYRHIDTYTHEDFETYNPDVVVYEIVERYAYTLGTFSF